MASFRWLKNEPYCHDGKLVNYKNYRDKILKLAVLRVRAASWSPLYKSNDVAFPREDHSFRVFGSTTGGRLLENQG
jgi:hypothetical protein